jgi:hypothetical protein
MAGQTPNSVGTSSYPVTGFPASAYTGNNVRGASGGQQGNPSTLASMFSNNAAQIDGKTLAIVLGVLIVIGYGAWHLDNRRG